MVFVCMSVTLKMVMRCIHSQLQSNGEKGAWRFYSRQQPFPEGIIFTHMSAFGAQSPFYGIQILSWPDIRWTNTVEFPKGKSFPVNSLCVCVELFHLWDTVEGGNHNDLSMYKGTHQTLEKEDYEHFSSTKKEESQLKTLTDNKRVGGVSIWTWDRWLKCC